MTKATCTTRLRALILCLFLFPVLSHSQYVSRYYSYGLKADIDTSLFSIIDEDNYPFLPIKHDELLWKKYTTTPKKLSTEDIEFEDHNSEFIQVYISNSFSSYYVISYQYPSENTIVDSLDTNGFRIYLKQTLSNSCDLGAAKEDTASTYDVVMVQPNNENLYVSFSLNGSFEEYTEAIKIAKHLALHMHPYTSEEADRHFNLPLTKPRADSLYQLSFDKVYQEQYNEMFRIYKCSDMRTLRDYLEVRFSEDEVDTLSVRQDSTIAYVYAQKFAQEETAQELAFLQFMVDSKFSFGLKDQVEANVLADSNRLNGILSYLLFPNEKGLYHQLHHIMKMQEWTKVKLPPSNVHRQIIIESQLLLRNSIAKLGFSEVNRTLLDENLTLSECTLIPNEADTTNALMLLSAGNSEYNAQCHRLLKLQYTKDKTWQIQEIKLPFDGDTAVQVRFAQYPLNNKHGFMLKYSPNGWDHYLIFNNKIDNSSAIETRYMSAVYGGKLKMCAINNWKHIEQMDANKENEYYAPLANIPITKQLENEYLKTYPVPDDLSYQYPHIYDTNEGEFDTNRLIALNDSLLISKQHWYAFVFNKLVPEQKEFICYPITADITGDGEDEFFQFAVSNGKLISCWVYTFSENGASKMPNRRAKRYIKKTTLYNNMKHYSMMGVVKKTIE